ncbi:MAG TPA: metal-dependent hydrolase [Gemmatimonadaceae bacterium]|jgi:inner membrane protein
MDPITHTLAGATMARAGLDRRTPLATAALLLGANAPDIDIFTALGEANATLACRRGWTHGPLAWIVLPFAVAGLLMAWDRWVRRRRDPSANPVRGDALLSLAALGVFSHPALDWLNTYGIRLLKPFSETWFRGDSVFIIDPWIWLLLGTGLIVARRAQPNQSRATRLARTAGMLALAYVATMIGLSVQGKRVTRSAADAAGIAPITEVLYSPRPANPFAADVVVRTPVAYHPGALRWLSDPRVTFTGIVIPRGDWDAPAVLRARATPAARNYLVWSQFPYVRVEVQGADTTVFFGDARYRAGSAGTLGGLLLHVSHQVPTARAGGRREGATP